MNFRIVLISSEIVLVWESREIPTYIRGPLKNNLFYVPWTEMITDYFSAASQNY